MTTAKHVAYFHDHTLELFMFDFSTLSPAADAIVIRHEMQEAERQQATAEGQGVFRSRRRSVTTAWTIAR